MRLTVCGARGSSPAPGPDFVRYGGHTLCIALARRGRKPELILDAGTGVRNVGALLGGEPFRGTILLGHLHWDHTQGLPFFSAGDRDDAEVTLTMPSQGDPVPLLTRMISPPFFPIGPLELRGRWSFLGLEAGEHVIEGFTVLALEIPHKGGRMFGYRISDGNAAITYMSDHSPIAHGPGPAGLGEYHDAARALASGVDLLIHDAQHTAQEFPERAFLGHSTMEYAVGLAEECGVRRLLLFHHDPARTDDALDSLVNTLSSHSVTVEAAYEGQSIELPSEVNP